MNTGKNAEMLDMKELRCSKAKQHVKIYLSDTCSAEQWSTLDGALAHFCNATSKGTATQEEKHFPSNVAIRKE